MASHADTHDLDKLRRWQKDLEAAPSDAPGVYAIFLVSGEDRAAHNVFRAFRTSFEERDMGFAHLVIFGQHGVSETCRRMRDRFGLEAGGGPSLALLAEGGSQIRVVPLPVGEECDSHVESGGGWQEALNLAMSAIDSPSNGDHGALQFLKDICTELSC